MSRTPRSSQFFCSRVVRRAVHGVCGGPLERQRTYGALFFWHSLSVVTSHSFLRVGNAGYRATWAPCLGRRHGYSTAFCPGELTANATLRLAGLGTPVWWAIFVFGVGPHQITFPDAWAALDMLTFGTSGFTLVFDVFGEPIKLVSGHLHTWSTHCRLEVWCCWCLRHLMIGAIVSSGVFQFVLAEMLLRHVLVLPAGFVPCGTAAAPPLGLWR